MGMAGKKSLNNMTAAELRDLAKKRDDDLKKARDDARAAAAALKAAEERETQRVHDLVIEKLSTKDGEWLVGRKVGGEPQISSWDALIAVCRDELDLPDADVDEESESPESGKTDVEPNRTDAETQPTQPVETPETARTDENDETHY